MKIKSKSSDIFSIVVEVEACHALLKVNIMLAVLVTDPAFSVELHLHNLLELPRSRYELENAVDLVNGYPTRVIFTKTNICVNFSNKPMKVLNEG